MNYLINDQGLIDFGLFETGIDVINYKDYRLQTPLGLPIPGFMKNLKLNQFHFFGLMGPEVMLGMAVVDLKLLTNGFFDFRLSTASIPKASPSHIIGQHINDWVPNFLAKERLLKDKSPAIWSKSLIRNGRCFLKDMTNTPLDLGLSR